MVYVGAIPIYIVIAIAIAIVIAIAIAISCYIVALSSNKYQIDIYRFVHRASLFLISQKHRVIA